MGSGIEEKLVEDNICIPSTPPRGLVCGKSKTLSDGDLAKEKFKLPVNNFGDVGSTPKKSGIRTRESDHIEIQEMPHGDALEVKSVGEVALEVKSVGEVASSKDESYKIQTKQNMHIVVVGLSSPASAPSTPFNQNVRKRHNSANPLKQTPRKKHNSSTDKPDQKPKLKKIKPQIFIDEDNTKCTPNTQLSKLNFKPKTPVMTSTHKAQTKRTYIRKNCSKLVADSSKNLQSEAATKSLKRALKYDLENTAGDRCNLFENKDDQAVNVDLAKKVEKQCSLPVHHEMFKINQSLINIKESVSNFPKMCKKRRMRRLVHIRGSCRNVKTAEVGKRSGKSMILNTKLDCTSEESQDASESLDMYSAVKIKKRRLAGSTQRPFMNVTSFPKEDPSQLHISEEDFTKNHYSEAGKRVGLAAKEKGNKKNQYSEVGKRVGLAAKEKGNKKRWRKLQLSGTNNGQVVLQDQNIGSLIDHKKKHIFRAKVDLDEESDRVYNLLVSNGGSTFDQEAEADSGKKEYWDRERNLTRIRVESFISTIGMIQGDRSFSPWKGSVVDSVVGAFLTQNVCDHHSSSAFMSLAARFPNHKLNGKSKCTGKERDDKTMDVVDWEAVRQANVDDIAETIKERGMNNVIAGKIKDFLNKIVEDHGSPDLEWLRDAPSEEAKNYLLNIFGIGLKSGECIRLLTLHHVAFPVDINVLRVAVRLGWVPLKPLPGGLQMHLLEMYPVVNSVQKYLYPRLCTLDQEKLYLLHYHLITFGKVFCTKRKPNCNACPMRGECKYFASSFASHRLPLPAPERKDIVTAQNLVVKTTPLVLEIDPDMSDLEYQRGDSELGSEHLRQMCEPIIEHPASPQPSEPEDIEDLYKDSDELNGFGNYDDDDIPIIRIDNEACINNIIEYTKRNNISFEGDMSKILALLNSSAPLPMHPLKHVGRLRTVHQVYELPDDHPILHEADKRDPDDPSPYLFAVWNEGKPRSSISQTLSSGQQVRLQIVCNCSEPDCKSLVSGTLLIPVRSANHGTFPLNGTYFQVNEVFADDQSSQQPIVVPRNWLWGLTRRNLYCGTSPTTTFKGFTLDHIQHALCKGFFCNRGYNRETRNTTPLSHRFHINTRRKKADA